MTRSGGNRVLGEIHIMADKSKSLRESPWITMIFLLILIQKTQKINWKAANYLDMTFFPTHQCFSRPWTTIHWLFKAVWGIYFVPRLFLISRTDGHLGHRCGFLQYWHIKFNLLPTYAYPACLITTNICSLIFLYIVNHQQCLDKIMT